MSMTQLYGLVGYRPAGLRQPTLLSATKIEASVLTVAFGEHTAQETKISEISPSEKRARAWLQREHDRLQSVWREALAEPSFRADFALSPLETLETPLFDVDDGLMPAAVLAALVRSLAERAGVNLPPLADSVVIVGAIAADGMLSHRPHSLSEIVQAVSGISDRVSEDRSPTRYLIGPFLDYDSEIASQLKDLSLTIQPVRTCNELLRVILGDHAEHILKVVLEQLVLFDGRTQGDEAKEWQALEARWAEHPQNYEKYVARLKKRRPKSTTLQRAIVAAETLVALRNGTDVDASYRLSIELGSQGYLLTAIWLLVRRSFLLRERRETEAADACLLMAQSLQRRVPFAVDSTVLLHQLGRSCYYQARFVDGLKLHWQGYQLLTADARDDVPGADFFNSAGKCFNDLYQLPLALELFERARPIYERRRQVGKLLFNTGAQAEAYWRIGEFARARELYEENLEYAIEAEQGTSDQPNVMRGKNNVALALLAQGQLSEAEQLYAETTAYYRAAYRNGNPRELGSLMFSVAGIAHVSAAQGQWELVETLIASHFPEAEREIDPQKDPTCLPVALFAFVNAQRLRRNGDFAHAAQWLAKTSHLLSHFYPMEQAMVRLEQLLLIIATQANATEFNDDDQLTILQQAREQMTTFLDSDSEIVSQQFVSFRERLARGQGALAEDGKRLYEAEERRRAELEANFSAVADHLRANRTSEAVAAVRAIQRFVPYFRDLITQLKLDN